MDESGAGSSRKRRRGASSSTPEHQEATTRALHQIVTTEQAPVSRRSKSALRRERNREETAAKRQEQASTVHLQASLLEGDPNGDESVTATASDQGPSSVPGQRCGRAGPSALPPSPGSNSRSNAMRRGRRRRPPTPDKVTLSAVQTDSLAQEHDCASDASAPAAGLLLTFGGSRAEMRSKDLKAAAATAATSNGGSQKSSSSKANEEEEEEEEEAASKRALVDARIALSKLQSELDQVKADNRSKSLVIESQTSALSYVYGQASCSICLELAFRPHILSPCGHTFCARCLIDWFQRPSEGESLEIPSYFSPEQRRGAEIKATKARRKVCPHCRGDVRTAPAEVWSIKGMVDRLDVCHRSGVLTIEGGAPPIPLLTVQEERLLRGLDLASGSELWQDIFDDRPADEAIYDEAEGIFRCRRCTAEVLGNECVACGYFFPDLEPDGFEDGSLDGDSASDASDMIDFIGTELDNPIALHGGYDEEDDEGWIVNDSDDVGGVAEGGTSSSEDDLEVIGQPLRTNAIVGRRNPRSSHRRYGYSSDESGHAIDEEGSNHTEEDDGEPQEATGSSQRRRLRAIVVDSDDEHDEYISRSWNPPGLVISDDEEVEGAQEANVDDEDAHAADRWLSNSQQDNAKEDHQEQDEQGLEEDQEDTFGRGEVIPEQDTSIEDEEEENSDEDTDEPGWCSSDQHEQMVTSDDERSE